MNRLRTYPLKHTVNCASEAVGGGIAMPQWLCGLPRRNMILFRMINEDLSSHVILSLTGAEPPPQKKEREIAGSFA